MRHVIGDLLIGVFRTIGVRLRRARPPPCLPKPFFPKLCIPNARFRCNTGFDTRFSRARSGPGCDIRVHGACARIIEI